MNEMIFVYYEPSPLVYKMVFLLSASPFIYVILAFLWTKVIKKMIDNYKYWKD